jgi:hypothetical protein
MVPLIVQYVLVAAIVGSGLTDPPFGIRLTLGLAISAILYNTANRMEGLLERASADAGTPAAPAIRDIGPVFRLLALLLGALLAFGIWSSAPASALSNTESLAAYWLGAVGLCLVLVSSDPLRMGVGILVLTNGFEVAYLSLETSLLVVASMGLVDILIALAVAYVNENWLESVEGSVRP